MVRIRVEANYYRIGKKFGDFFIAVISRENRSIEIREEINLEAADGLCGPENGITYPVGVEFDQCPVAFLHLNDTVLDWHGSFVNRLNGLNRLKKLIHEAAVCLRSARRESWPSSSQCTPGD